MKHQFELESYSFRESGFFSDLICDYAEQKESLKPLVDGFPSFYSLKQKASSRNHFPLNRDVLVSCIEKQYKDQSILSEKVQEQLMTLAKETTVTVTTGHQLNIFGGPLYVVYKIIDILKLAKELNSNEPVRHHIPVFWMASEDHDFEEVAKCKVFGKEIVWETEQSGAVGRMHLDEFQAVLDAYTSAIGLGVETAELKQLFQNAYHKKYNLAQATRYWVAELFKDSDLLIIDGDDAQLKQLFVPIMQKELKESLVESSMRDTNNFLRENYHLQVNPREINLFYLDQGVRARIERTASGFALVGHSKSWTELELFEELKNNPERFSPNALMRPMYQECILPNISYTGGGGEMAYWLQMKNTFDAFGLSFPILLVRNSWHFVEQKVTKRLEKLDLTGKGLFQERAEWEKSFISKLYGEELQLNKQFKGLQDQIANLKAIASNWDVKLEQSIEAEQARLLRSFKRLERKVKSAAKRKSKNELDYFHRWMDELFDPAGMQERSDSLSTMYCIYGKQWLSYLLENTNPIQTKFHLVKVQSN